MIVAMILIKVRRGFINQWDLRAAIALFSLNPAPKKASPTIGFVKLGRQIQNYKQRNQPPLYSTKIYTVFLICASPATSSPARLGLLGTLETRQNMFFHRAEAPRDSINGALLTRQPASQATTFIHKLHQMILPNLFT